MEIAVNANAIAAVALLSRYNWFNITAENAKDGKSSSFCATGINVDKYGYMTFERQFSQPRYSFGAIVDVTATDEDKFSFLTTAGTVYNVEASNKALADRRTASGSADDPASLIDWSRSEIDGEGNTLVVLDLRKLGNISPALNRRIQQFMNVDLDGYANPYQVCRTIYFCKEGEEIYSGLYNLETEQPMTKVLYCPTELDWLDNPEDQATKDKVRQMMQEAVEKLGEVIPF